MRNCWIFRESRRASSRAALCSSGCSAGCAIADLTARALSSTKAPASRMRGFRSSTSPAGAQPMSNDDGTVSITFNGEIFNYVELREELIARGHKFRTHLRHRSHHPPLRGDGAGLRRAAERRFRLRDLGRPPPAADAGARPHGRAPAVLRASAAARSISPPR